MPHSQASVAAAPPGQFGENPSQALSPATARTLTHRTACRAHITTHHQESPASAEHGTCPGPGAHVHDSHSTGTSTASWVRTLTVAAPVQVRVRGQQRSPDAAEVRDLDVATLHPHLHAPAPRVLASSPSQSYGQRCRFWAIRAAVPHALPWAGPIPADSDGAIPGFPAHAADSGGQRSPGLTASAAAGGKTADSVTQGPARRQDGGLRHH